MEMQFDKIPVACLQKLGGGLRSQEQTLEVRLPDGMPDIGRVLGAWGQVIVRGKEWSADAMSVSCGVMVWVLYAPEEEAGVHSVEAWLPFSLKWDLPDAAYDGNILTSCLLRSLDARSTSARKLMVRATISALGEAWMSGQAQLASPCQLPADVRVLTASYPVMLPQEAGEKSFALEETLTPPATGAKPEQLLYYSLQPEILDRKIMAGKVVFRGNAWLHVLCCGDDGRLYPWDFELPFSQYGELAGMYDGEPSVTVAPCVTSLDVSLDENGLLQLKAGILGQYLLCSRTALEVVEDAYSPIRPLTLETEQLQVPAVLDEISQSIRAEQTASVDAQQVVDVAFYPENTQAEYGEDGAALLQPGRFRVLYYDPEGMLESMLVQWENPWEISAAQGAKVDAWTAAAGKPQAAVGAGSIGLRAELNVDARVMSGSGIPMVTGITAGEAEKPDPNRPSLILCRKGQRRLWDVAKETGSTVEAIMTLNRLEGEPPEEQVLLIPVS